MKRNSTTISISIMLVCLMVFTSFQGIEARKDNRTYTYHDLILDNTTSGEINAKESVGVTEKNNKKK